jgi:DNA polymerase III subunit alpha
MSDFAHLHLHTHYSLLDGLGTPADYAKQMIGHNQKSAAITDHGNLYGVVEWYKTLKKNDLHPVIGCEVYFTHDRAQRTKGGKNSNYHMLLFAENNEGYQNLLQLITKANLEGFYMKPRIDWELLKRFGKGLIGTSGCLSSLASGAILSGNDQEAIDHLRQYEEILGKENFYLEVQHHPSLDDQFTVNEKLYEFSNILDIPLLATNDCHYVGGAQHKAHDVLLCVQTNSQVAQSNRMKFEDDFSLLSTKKMVEIFKDYPQAIASTIEIAERCKVEIAFGRNLLPHFPTPQEEAPEVYLRELVTEGLFARYKMKSERKEVLDPESTEIHKDDVEVFERMNFELKVIHDMGFDAYFLIVWDFIKAARDKGIVVGPGRGSAAGAIVAYCLRITDLDPIKYELLFERFLNPARVSMPDIDIDFQDDRREEVLEYVKEKYGEDHVAQVITFGTMSAKAAVKDVGRVHGVPFAEMNQVTKLIPGRPGITLREALDEEVELKNEYDSNEIIKGVYDTALELEGTIRQAGVHACAVIISPTPISDYTALQKAPGSDDTIITQLPMKPLEAMGLLKMDFLGLRNLTIIKDTLRVIEERHGEKLEVDKLPMDDKAAYELMARGDTTGVFQLESSGMKRYLKDLKPTEFEDIIAMVSLFRPGPMDFIPTYINGKHGKIEVKYVHDDLKPILSKTYGIAIYQEQILQIAQKFAGFSLGEADLLRRAIGKKIAKELKAQRVKFIDGGVEKGYGKKLAVDIFDKVIEPFANYGFNKSHAACYALISYQTAYLKAHYPTEFMAALLTADQDNNDRLVIDIQECEKVGITLMPPDINESFRNFRAVADKQIRYGFKGIKNLGSDTIGEIINDRDTHGMYKTLGELVSRIPAKSVNKKSFEALAMSGSLDSLAERNSILQSIDVITTFAKEHGQIKSIHADQSDIFGMIEEEDAMHHELPLMDVPPASRTQKLQWEKQVFGIFISEHPLHGLRRYLMSRMTLMGNLNGSHYEKEITLGGIVTAVKKITTKKGDEMASVEIEDGTGTMSCVLFPRTWAKYKTENYFGNDEYVVFATGRLERRGGDAQLMIQECKKGNIETMRQNAKEMGSFDEYEGSFSPHGGSSGASEVIHPEHPDGKVGLTDITHTVAQFAYDRLENSTKNTFTDDEEGDIVYRLKSDLSGYDLQKIKEILQNHPGKRIVKLDLLVEGSRSLIDTKVSVKHTAGLLNKMSPYMDI